MRLLSASSNHPCFCFSLFCTDFEHPTGVGFSYCSSCLGNSSCVCSANDTSAAEDNYEAVQAFFEKFPQFRENKFYITGESCENPFSLSIKFPFWRAGTGGDSTSCDTLHVHFCAAAAE